jgi:DNA-binding MarR family transcriptional regulator
MISKSTPPAIDPAALLQLDSQLCFALYSTSLAMTKLYQPLLAELGVTYPQYLVLLALWETDDLTVSQLGERLRLDSGTLTPLLKRMESAGLIQRQRATDDERRVQITLTAQARKLRQRALKVPEQVLCGTQCSLSEVRALTKRLQSLRDRLANAG